jgi:hypothetical protein
MLSLEKPATAYLLEIDVTLTSSSLDRTHSLRAYLHMKTGQAYDSRFLLAERLTAGVEEAMTTTEPNAPESQVIEPIFLDCPG